MCKHYIFIGNKRRESFAEFAQRANYSRYLSGGGRLKNMPAARFQSQSMRPRRSIHLDLHGTAADAQRPQTLSAGNHKLLFWQYKKQREAALRLLLHCIGPSYNLHRFSAGGLSPACFTASIIRPQTAAGRPANHMLIRHPL